ncbi:hypothetical protein [Trabulsiella odontotermitis]|uniref:hypothetical protein n=1 Tax=Trabulsiella odontotermitis TaxID=379893 RepID=UPI0006BA0F38|nr:hypothetical protein [Trabulsiella odontotermitis]
MPRYRSVIVKFEEIDDSDSDSVIEPKWAVYDSEAGVVLSGLYALPHEAEQRVADLNKEYDVSLEVEEIKQSLDKSTSKIRHPGSKN